MTSSKQPQLTHKADADPHVAQGHIVPFKNQQEVKRKGGPKFSPRQRELVLARVAELYLKAIGVQAIGQDIGVSTQMAINYVKELEKRWKASAIRDFDQAKGIELAKLDHLEQQYWDAWERSCLEHTESHTIVEPKMVDGKEVPTRKRQTIKKIEEVGDPRFLDGVYKCIDRRIKLLGLDAAERHILETRGGPENALDQRLAKYAIVFGPAALAATAQPAGNDNPDESVDSERPAPETSGILDASYIVR